jgi:phosphatidylinositol alpha-mannosyltransferase
MAVGRPIVATQIAGYTDVMTHGDEGLCVPPKDDDQLAEALITMITDDTLRQEMAARTRPKALKYDWARLARQVFNFYLETLGRIPKKETVPEVEATLTGVASGTR